MFGIGNEMFNIYINSTPSDILLVILLTANSYSIIIMKNMDSNVVWCIRQQTNHQQLGGMRSFALLSPVQLSSTVAEIICQESTPQCKHTSLYASDGVQCN